MRHGSLELTMGCYTDPRLLDTAGALDALPALPLGGGEGDREAAQATGTDAWRSRALAPTLAPTTDNWGQAGSTSVRPNTTDHWGGSSLSGIPVISRGRLTKGGKVEPTGIEPVTSALRTLRSPS